MAKLTTAEIIDAIKELTVLELNDLVKACEEEFGVSAAAGVVVAAAAGGDAAAAGEEKSDFNEELTEEGPNKVKFIKGLREESRLRSGFLFLLISILKSLKFFVDIPLHLWYDGRCIIVTYHAQGVSMP